MAVAAITVFLWRYDWMPIGDVESFQSLQTPAKRNTIVRPSASRGVGLVEFLISLNSCSLILLCNSWAISLPKCLPNLLVPAPCCIPMPFGRRADIPSST
jgi:hypothetical protein